MTSIDTKMFIGEAAEKYRGLLKLSYPIERGVVKDWDDMDAIFKHIFRELDVTPKDHPVLLTEPPQNPIRNRIRLA